MNANNCTIVGRLAREPELKGYKKADQTDGFRCFLSVATTRLGDLGRPQSERRVNFIPVVCWGALAKRVAQHLNKGTEVTIVGELICESKKQGEEYKNYIHIQANSVQFGRRSMKNASAEDIQAQMAAMQERVESLASGASATPPATGDMPTPDGTPDSAQNPFESSAA